MKRFIEGDNREQSTLLPACLEDFVTEDNPVRVVDVFIDALNLEQLGFDGAVPAETGRPGYHPTTLLKLYVYGYLNRLQSSRRLEREAQRNLELLWLLRRLTPDFKTIADFRKDNGPAIRRVAREFVVLCRRLDLFSEAIVAIDGSKFKAVNNRDKNFTEHKLKARIAQIEESIGRYLVELDRADREPALVTEARVSSLKEKLDAAKTHIQALQTMGQQLEQTPDRQISLTDPDARSMATSGRGTGIVGYNVQIAVDTQHHLIVAHEVTNVGHDKTALHSMAVQAREAVGEDDLIAIADRGYFKGAEVAACEDAGVIPLLPRPQTSNNLAAGLFDKKDFRYIAEKDEYECPAGERLTHRFSVEEQGQTLRKYATSACPHCVIKARCTTVEKCRRIARSEYEDALDRMQRRLDNAPQAMRIRRRTVEHAFGTLKAWMGATHFLTRTLPRVSTEMSLNILAYNLKRMLQILGVRTLMGVIEA